MSEIDTTCCVSEHENQPSGSLHPSSDKMKALKAVSKKNLQWASLNLNL